MFAYLIIACKIFRSRDHDVYDHPSEYDRYGTPPPAVSKHSSSHHAPYDSSSYERDYRRDYHAHSSSYAAAYAGKFIVKSANFMLQLQYYENKRI